MFLIKTLLAVALFWQVSFAQGTFATSEIQTYEIQSKINNETYEIKVSYPLHSKRYIGREYPVLYVTDGNLMFDMVVNQLRYMELSDFIMPRNKDCSPNYIVVGIGYKVADGNMMNEQNLGQIQVKRQRDMDPDYYRDGGAGKFSAVIKNEIVPFVENLEKVSKKHKTYFGHSFGATFGLYSVFSENAVFDQLILSSASYHGSSMRKMVQLIHNPENEKPKANIIFTSGSVEQKWEDFHKNNNIVKKQIAESGSKESITSEVLLLEGDDHFGVIGNALSKGLQKVRKNIREYEAATNGRGYYSE